MNRRQAQRSLADVVSKCEAAHIQLPEDPLEALAEAVEAIVHSDNNGKVNLSDAQDELQQKFGVESAWKQQLEDEENKRQRRRAAHQKKGPIRGKRLAQDDMGLGFLPEPPPLDDASQIGASSMKQRDHVGRGKSPESSQGPKSNASKQRTLGTPSKRLTASPASSTDVYKDNSQTTVYSMKSAKKSKSARNLIAPGDAEEKPPAGAKKSVTEAVGAVAVDNSYDNRASSGSEPDQEIIDLLEDIEEAEGASDSDEDFTL